MYDTFTASCEKSKMLYFGSSIRKDIAVFASPFRSRFPVKLICCIVFGSASSACCFFKSYCCHFVYLLK